MARPPAKAQAVADQLAHKIATGEYAPGDWLPAQRTLGDQLGADRGTVGRALNLLAGRGLIELVEGNGARVIARTVTQLDTADLTRGDGTWQGFGAAVARAGGELYVEVVGVTEVDAPPTAARELGIPVGTRVLLRDRTHGVVEGGERRPAEIAMTWITTEVADRAPAVREVDTGPGGITARITEAGYQMRYEDITSARLPNVAEQDRLDIDADQPVLDVWRRSYDQTNRVIKASNRIINPLRHQLVHRY